MDAGKAMWRMAWFSDLAEQRPLIVELMISSAVAALTGAYLAAMSDLPGSVVLSRMSFTFASLLVVRDLSRGAIAADRAGAPKPLTRWCMGFGQCVQFALVLMILNDTTRIGPIWLLVVILIGALLGAWNAADRAFWEEPATERGRHLGWRGPLGSGGHHDPLGAARDRIGGEWRRHHTTRLPVASGGCRRPPPAPVSSRRLSRGSQPAPTGLDR
ncbi:hypothetical protein [Limimaricola soesokkakensis]|uniref:hypothetical protein n=1 Tax=Limimaricola soesokkakensis TaxID=1343159 RepID=UPI003511427F